jgi:hypothetical protein
MIHPIFSVLISRPELVAEHVAGYAALVQEEAATVGSAAGRKAAAWAVAGVSLIVFLVLAGVAAMLGAINAQFHWALVVVPAIPLVLAVVAISIARKPMPGKAFVELKAQIDADAQALRSLGARS